MFDVGFSEMVTIAIVALIVIGPEKMPKVARTLGLLVGRMQRYVAQVKTDIQREMQIEDLQKLQHEIQQGITQTQTEVSSLHQSMKTGIQQELDALEKEISSSLVVDHTAKVNAEPPVADPKQLALATALPPRQQSLDLNVGARDAQDIKHDAPTDHPLTLEALQVEHPQAGQNRDTDKP